MQTPSNYQQRFSTEAELVQRLVQFLCAEGYRVRQEVPCLGQSADVVCTRSRYVTFVEAKLLDWGRGLLQCRSHEQVADFICLAVAGRRVSDKLTTLASERGYGIIWWNSSSQCFDWVLRPKRTRNVWHPERRRLGRAFRRIDYVR